MMISIKLNSIGIYYFIVFFVCQANLLYVKGQERNDVEKINISQIYPLKVISDADYSIPGYISNKNGTLITQPANYLSTTFIDVADCNMVECRLPLSKVGGIAFYNKKRQFLSAISCERGGIMKVTIPPGTSFIRLSKRIDCLGIIYHARFFKSETEDSERLLQKGHDQLQRLNSGLYTALVPDYKPVFQYGDFVYNAVDAKGIGFIDSNKVERYHPIFRIPIHLKTKHGTILIAASVVREQKDLKGYSIIMARSTDGGMTFEKRNVCSGTNQSMVYDEVNDCVFLFHGLTYSVSTDDGLTWSEFRQMNIEKPEGWEKFYTSPTIGIQLTNGVLAVPYILMDGAGKNISKNSNAVVYSTDFGKTWNVSVATPDDIIANETTIAEYAPNQIMINARGGTEVQWGSANPGRRIFIPMIASSDKRTEWQIKGWKLHESDKLLIEPICNASFIACLYRKFRFALFCNPYTQEAERKNLMLQVSSDFTHWTKVGLLTPYNRNLYGYCSLNYQAGKLSFVFEDMECGILYADLSFYLDEILTRMIANKILYE